MLVPWYFEKYDTSIKIEAMTTYSERLRLARKHKDMSQTQLSSASGVGQGTISKIERGDQTSLSSRDAALAHALGVHPLWLQRGDEEFAPSWITGKPDTIDFSDPIHKNIIQTLAIAKQAIVDSGGKFSEDQLISLYRLAVDRGLQKSFDDKTMRTLIELINQ